MGSKYREFVRNESVEAHWSSIDNILDFEEDCDLGGESDHVLALLAAENLRTLIEEAEEVLARLEEKFLSGDVILVPGDVVPDLGTVDANHCGLPWPVSPGGELYYGCVKFKGRPGLFDARTGRIVADPSSRDGNEEFDYCHRQRDNNRPERELRLYENSGVRGKVGDELQAAEEDTP